MHAIKLNGKDQIDLARETVRLVQGSTAIEGSTLRFDSADLADLEEILRSAESYWMRMKRRPMAKAAETLWRKVAEIRAAESYALSFAN